MPTRAELRFEARARKITNRWNIGSIVNDHVLISQQIRLISTIACIVICVTLSGCGLINPPQADNPSSILADWSDAEPAAFHALTAGECAILTTERPDDRTLVFNLLSITSDEGELRFVRNSPPTPTSVPADPGTLTPEKITVSAFLGIASSRDRIRERRLVAASIMRLRELTGRDWAPAKN